MDCKKTRQLLSEYIDGQLNNREARNIEKHLSDCSSCAQEYEELKKLVKELNKASGIKAPENFLNGVRKKQKEDSVKTGKLEFLKNFWNKTPRVAVTAAAAIILIILLFDFERPDDIIKPGIDITEHKSGGKTLESGQENRSLSTISPEMMQNGKEESAEDGRSSVRSKVPREELKREMDSAPPEKAYSEEYSLKNFAASESTRQLATAGRKGTTSVVTLYVKKKFTRKLTGDTFKKIIQESRGDLQEIDRNADILLLLVAVPGNYLDSFRKRLTEYGEITGDFPSGSGDPKVSFLLKITYQ